MYEALDVKFVDPVALVTKRFTDFYLQAHFLKLCFLFFFILALHIVATPHCNKLKVLARLVCLLNRES
jgi:hypothetical protein